MPTSDRRPSFPDVIRYFLGLGTWGFGGPIATVGYMQRGPGGRPALGRRTRLPQRSPRVLPETLPPPVRRKRRNRWTRRWRRILFGLALVLAVSVGSLRHGRGSRGCGIRRQERRHRDQRDRRANRRPRGRPGRTRQRSECRSREPRQRPGQLHGLSDRGGGPPDRSHHELPRLRIPAQRGRGGEHQLHAVPDPRLRLAVRRVHRRPGADHAGGAR
jgi:hypothetical protein